MLKKLLLTLLLLGGALGTGVRPLPAQINLETQVKNTLPHGNGGTDQTAATLNSVLVGGGTAWGESLLPGCLDTGGNHLNYNNSTQTFTCGTSGGGGGGGVNTQTGNYTLVAGDAGKLVVMNCSAACTVTVYGTPTSTYYAGIESIGSATATLSLNSLNLNGQATAPALNSFESVWFYSDGTNYWGTPPLYAGAGLTFTFTGQARTLALSSTSLTVTAGAGLSGGGSVSLGGATTVNCASVTTSTEGCLTAAQYSALISGGAPSLGTVGGIIGNFDGAGGFCPGTGGNGCGTPNARVGVPTGFVLSPLAITINTNSSTTAQAAAYRIPQIYSYGTAAMVQFGWDPGGVVLAVGTAPDAQNGSAMPISPNLMPLVDFFDMDAATLNGWSDAIYGADTQPIFVYLDTTIGASATSYMMPSTYAYGTPTENLATMPVPVQTQFDKMCVAISGTQSTSTMVISLDDVPANLGAATSTALAVTIPANGANNTFCDLTDVVTIPAGDGLSIRAKNNYTSTSATIINITLEAIPVAPYTGIISFTKANLTLVASTTYYYPPFSNSPANETTAAAAWVGMPRALTVSAPYCTVEAAPANTATVDFDKNGSISGAPTVSVTSAGAAIVAGTGTLAFNDLDTLNMQITAGAGTVPTIPACSVAIQ